MARAQKRLSVLIAVAVLSVSTSAFAANTARVFGATLFVAGAGLTFGGTIVGNDAQETYDQYLLTARQSEIAALRQDYVDKQKLSDTLSNTGAGLIAAGALIAMYSILKGADEEPVARATGLSVAPNLGRRQVAVLWRRGF